MNTQKLRETIEAMIYQGIDTFYVGNEGMFDAAVHTTLRQLKAIHPHIRYAVVLAYLPTERDASQDYSDTMFPEGIEECPPRFAIEHRNRWLLRHAECVICYVRYSWGGAYKFCKAAQRQGKTVINICEMGVHF